jgi:hypothetical protein
MALFARAPLLCVAFLAIAPLLCALVENEVQMTLYMSQVIEGPKTNDISVVPTGGFGTISVNDWAILDGPDPSAKVVGRAQGLHTASSQSENSWFTAVNLVHGRESSISSKNKAHTLYIRSFGMMSFLHKLFSLFYAAQSQKVTNNYLKKH